jgi:hypothetical protein
VIVRLLFFDPSSPHGLLALLSLNLRKLQLLLSTAAAVPILLLQLLLFFFLCFEDGLLVFILDCLFGLPVFELVRRLQLVIFSVEGLAITNSLSESLIRRVLRFEIVS